MGIYEKHYSVDEQEMLAIVKACKHWRHYIEGAAHTIRVLTDYMNLCTFFFEKILKPQEARWWEQLSGLDLAIEYRERKKNPANSLSHCPDYYRDKTDNIDETYRILGYVTQSLVKAQRKVIELAQRAAEEKVRPPKVPKPRAGPIKHR